MKSLRLSGNLCRLLDAVVAIATGLSLIAITMACLPERFGRGEDFVLFVLFALSRRATVQFFVLLILATAVYGTVRRGLASRMWSAFKRLVGDDETSCLIRVGLVCGSIGVSFISMELLSYAVYPMPARTQWLKPYVHLAGIPNSPYDGNTKLNALGYNGKLPERRADQFSIFLLGGSTVWYGNPSIASALETVAQENGYSNISVFNFGVAGANSAQELARLVYEVVDYHPDMIIFYDGGNDIVHPASFMDPRPCYPIEQIVQEWNPFDALRSHEPSRLVMLLSASYLLRQTIVIPHLDYFFDLEQLRRDVGWGTDQWRQRIAECYVTNHEKGRAISNSFGAKFHSFFQPLLAYTNPEDKRSVVSEHTNLLRAMILKNAVEKGLPLTDLTLIFKDHGLGIEPKNAFLDWVHIRQEFHVQIAKKIFETIRSDLPRR